MSYSTDFNPQTCTEPKRDMIQGRGGGYGYSVDDVERLRRFLVLGHTGGTYYADQRTLTFETVDCLDRLPPEVAVETIVDVSTNGRAPKNDPAIFAMAYLSCNPEAASLVYEALPSVCRIGTHLFTFLEDCKNLGRGWGSGFRKAVANWYTSRSPLAVARQVTKYAQRGGWSHRDVLRLAHPTTSLREMNDVFQYITQPASWATNEDGYNLSPSNTYLCAVEEAKTADPDRLCRLIFEYGLVREHIPTEHLNNLDVWDALLQNMPLTAMIRNLGKMTSMGLIKPLSDASLTVVDALSNTEALKAQRVHPMALLVAQRMYARGAGFRGSLTWRPDQKVLAALDDAFYMAFDHVEPTGKAFLLGVDISGSMRFNWRPCCGCEVLLPAEAAAAMAMLAVRTEPRSHIVAFSRELQEIDVNPNDSLDAVLGKLSGMKISSTRCGAPIEYAMERGLDVDAFCIYTDNETNTGPHPSSVLNEYRKVSGRDAKLAVFGLAATDFTVADPNDPGMMDFVGFDAAAPTLLANFVTS